MIERPILAAINHLLADETWALDRLRPFAGKTLRVVLAPGPTLVARIDAHGHLVSAPDDDEPSLVVETPLSALPRLLRDEASLPAGASIVGDADLAQALRYVAARLDWDAEGDLARVIGDIPARRLSAAAGAIAAVPRDAGKRIAENVREYVHDEARLLVGRDALDGLAAGIGEASDALDRLEARIARLEESLRATR